MNRELPQDYLIYLLIGLSIVAALFLMSLFRMVALSRSNKRLKIEKAKMEKQTVLQEMEVTSMHHDAMSWRSRIQRQFEALRADLSARLQQSDQGGANALKELDALHQQTLAVALSKISGLEAALAAKSVTSPAVAAPKPQPAPAPAPPPVPVSLPALPAMETLRVQSLEAELASAKAELAASKQQNAVLQRSLLLARRKPATPLRKSHSRGSMSRSA